MNFAARAPGKVNLCLYLGRTRADGLHPLVSVVQPVSLADDVTIRGLSEFHGDVVVCPGIAGDNLAAAALAAFRARTGWDGPPVELTIDKRVPVAAGMGGGSADAAAALRLAAHVSGIGVPDGIAAALGADVPAALAAERTFVTGAGEHVEPAGDPAPFGLVVLPSPHALATPAVFGEADRLGLPRTDAELTELAERVREFAHDLPDELVVNDLEAAARSLCPSIDDALADLRAAGARIAIVSGSGPTVVGLFDDLTQAQAAVRGLAAHHPGAAACTPVGSEYGAVRER